ncbi:RNA-directed DNA polymerase, eukaryota, reverse transcriptase zinc-binding domain protein [Tanacetum coccineum]
MLWDYLTLVMSNWEGEVVIMGDFNEVLNKSKRFGTTFNRHGADVFNLFIFNAGLEEVPLEGCSFTCCHKSATKMIKLNCFLISNSLLCSCPHISSITLDRYLSDHRPILMREVYYDYGPVPFRFCHYWFEVKGFDKFIEYSWKEAPIIESNSLVRMMKKLKYMKGKIHMWNKLNKEKSQKSKRSLIVELADCDAIIDKGEGEINVVNRRTEVVRLLQEVEKIQLLEAAQKAKIKWDIEGDENSKYYHSVINKKRNLLNIRGILVEGTWIDSPCLVKSEFLSHFKNWFEQPNDNRLHMDMNFSNTLNSDQVADLECQVSKEEIKRRYAMTCFFHQGSFPKGGNSSFVILIPKTPNANMVKDYRPISLIGSMYKIISKILANRLVVVLGVLVNEIQSDFVADKQILDGPFILNELVQWCKKKKKQSMVFKVDFEKAGSVIVNGSPTEEFQLYKGLKQGDPLSPFLFILVMESLHISFQRVVDVVLECFNRASGLRINMTKSKLLGISVKDDKVEQAAEKIGCNTLKIPFSYLGSKIGGCMSRIKTWNETVERMADRLSKWKFKTLSIGGRLILLKSVLGSMPMYHMSIFKVPKKVWRFITQGSSLWARVIKALHGDDGKISKKVKSCNGANTSFWEVAWRGESVFKILYPRLYALETQKQIDVASKLSHSDLDFSFRRPLRGGVEQFQFELLKVKVEGCILSDMMDRWFWALEGWGDFTVASVRKMIDDFMLPEVSSKTRWIKAVPIKVNVHAWKVKLDGLPTRLNISRRGNSLVTGSKINQNKENKGSVPSEIQKTPLKDLGGQIQLGDLVTDTPRDSKLASNITS